MATQRQRKTATDPRIFAEANITKAEGLSLLRSVLGYFFHISSVPNLLLIFSAEVKTLDINRNFLDRSGKLIVPFFVIIRHRCFIVHPYINSFVARISVGLSFWYFPFGDFLPIDVQNGLPTGPRFTTVKYKLVFNNMFTGGNGFGWGNVRVFKSKIVIFVMKRAAFHV